MKDEKTAVRFIIRPYGSSFQVVDPDTHLVWRTLPTRPEAQAWAGAASESGKNKK
jgi:hypothetical protein